MNLSGYYVYGLLIFLVLVSGFVYMVIGKDPAARRRDRRDRRDRDRREGPEEDPNSDWD